MSKLAQDLVPSPEAAFDLKATAALLKALGMLVWASHVGAMVAVSYRWWLLLAAWGVVLYFGVRVRLDAALLEMLARDPESGPGRLDEWLSGVGLRARGADRNIADRCQGARRLGRFLVYAFIGQIAATAVSLLRSSL